MIGLDTEGTGVEVHHGALPFFVTSCDEEGDQSFWEWDVDPLTRRPIIPKADKKEVREFILDADELVLQNAKFDVHYLSAAEVIDWREWPWEKTQDTLVAGHVLHSGARHDLTSMTLDWLGVDVQLFEDRLKKACQDARKLAKQRFPKWRIAKEGDPMLPALKSRSKKKKDGSAVEEKQEDKPWKNDTWLPRQLAIKLGYPKSHSWHTVTRDYGNSDSASTVELFKAQRTELKRLGLWEIYLRQMKLPAILVKMEQQAVTMSGERLKELKTRYLKTAQECEKKCKEISKGIITKMPENGSSNELKRTIFEHLKLPSTRKTKTGQPSTDQHQIDEWVAFLEPKSEGWQFASNLKTYRKRKTAVGYLESYQKFWLPLSGFPGWWILHPSLNQTGTATLRFSSSNPNIQQVSKQEMVDFGEESRSIRYVFGPGPGREWWKADAQNLELRILAFDSGEKDLIYVFEHPNDAPYFGSYHLVVFDLLHPKLFKEHGAKCKKLFESTWYHWTKGGNFSIAYGAQQETADRAFHVKGAFNLIAKRFPKMAENAQKQIALANRLGYVETIADKRLGLNRGYPIMCSRGSWGKVSPTVPLNYRTQSTAMWWTREAMIACDGRLEAWNRRERINDMMLGCRMPMQVHDELVFDFPAGKGSEPWKTNLAKVQVLRGLMEQGGKAIGVPTPVSVEYCPNNWAEGRAI